jgi:hypothetical protein
MEPMMTENESNGPQNDGPVEGEGFASEATDDKAVNFKEKVGGLFRGPAKAADAAVAGVVAAKDAFVDFLTANDAGAQRVADLAASAVAQVGEDLERGDLTAEERLHRHEANERLVKHVADNEKRVRKSNERAFAIAAFVVVTVVGGATAVAVAARENRA